MEIRNAVREDSEFVGWTVLTALDMDTSDLTAAKATCAEDFGIYSWKNAVIAVENGKPIGCIVSYAGDNYKEMRDFTWPKMWKDLDWAAVQQMTPETEPGEYYLDSLAILPEGRGKGLGRKLIEAAIKNGEAQGYRQFMLLVDIDKPRLHDYYSQIGFEDCGKINFFDHLYDKMKLIK